MTREEKEQTGKYVLQMARLLEDGCYQQEMLLKAVHIINEALEQESNTWSLDDAREDFMHDVYNTLAFLPTNEEANRIIDSFDRVTSSIKQEPILDRVRAEIEQTRKMYLEMNDIDWLNGCDYVLSVIDKYKAESEDK